MHILQSSDAFIYVSMYKLTNEEKRVSVRPKYSVWPDEKPLKCSNSMQKAMSCTLSATQGCLSSTRSA